MTLGFVILDTGALLATCCLALVAQAVWPLSSPSAIGPAASPFGFALLGSLTAFYYSHLYDLRVTRSFPDFVSKFPRALLLLGAVLGPAWVLWPGARIEIQMAAIIVSGSTLLLVPARAALYHAAQSRTLARRVLILGSGSLARDIAREIKQSPARGYTLLGVVDDSDADASDPDLPVVARIDAVDQYIERTVPDIVVVALGERRGRLPVDRLLTSWIKGTKVEDGIEFYERLTEKLAIESLSPSSVLFSGAFRKPRHVLLVRRLASVVVSLVGLVLTTPLMLVVAAVIKLESRGPVFFIQGRAGRGGRTFRLVKFRTMHERNAAARESVWEREVEGRVTRVGRWLRKTRIDELPQFFNILKGDMNLIGPRPEMATNVGEMTREIPYYTLRHVVRPGVTGWAQVRYGYSVSREEVAEKTRHDLYYVKHMSLGFDLRILADTATIVMFGRGAR
jgi:exopolysaccharide biosynthesis polyprenyl glycosylphosphotransferase